MLLYLIMGELYWLAVLCLNPPLAQIRTYSLSVSCIASSFVIVIWPLPFSFFVYRLLKDATRG